MEQTSTNSPGILGIHVFGCFGCHFFWCNVVLQCLTWFNPNQVLNLMCMMATVEARSRKKPAVCWHRPRCSTTTWVQFSINSLLLAWQVRASLSSLLPPKNWQLKVHLFPPPTRRCAVSWLSWPPQKPPVDGQKRGSMCSSPWLRCIWPEVSISMHHEISTIFFFGALHLVNHKQLRSLFFAPDGGPHNCESAAPWLRDPRAKAPWWISSWKHVPPSWDSTGGMKSCQRLQL